MFVAERRLPRDNQIIREIERNRNRVGYLAAILLRKNATGHVSSSWKRQVQGAHHECDLVHHIFGDVAARVVPEQTPIDELVGIERPTRTTVQKCVPPHVCFIAVGGNLSYPLPFATRGVATHPTLHRSDLAHETVPEPLLRIDQIAGTLMLQPDSDNTIRLLRCLEASLSFGNRPGHSLLAVKILASSERIQKVSRVAV